MKDEFSTGEFSVIVGVGGKTIRNWVKAGRIIPKSISDGRHAIFGVEQLREACKLKRIFNASSERFSIMLVDFRPANLVEFNDIEARVRKYCTWLEIQGMHKRVKSVYMYTIDDEEYTGRISDICDAAYHNKVESIYIMKGNTYLKGLLRNISGILDKHNVNIVEIVDGITSKAE